MTITLRSRNPSTLVTFEESTAKRNFGKWTLDPPVLPATKSTAQGTPETVIGPYTVSRNQLFLKVDCHKKHPKIYASTVKRFHTRAGQHVRW